MDNNPNIIEHYKQMQEANKITENLENNMLNNFDQIANDILKQKDYAIAMAFTAQMGKLLRDNGVVASYAIHEYDEKEEDAFTKHYGVVFDSIDFSEHDKEFLEEIDRLKTENSALQQELQEKALADNLPYKPIAVAQMLITAIAKYSDADETYNIYDVSDLRQIAEHLLVYCNNNKDEG